MAPLKGENRFSLGGSEETTTMSDATRLLGPARVCFLEMASRISGIANFKQNKKHESQPSSPARIQRVSVLLANFGDTCDTSLRSTWLFDGDGSLILKQQAQQSLGPTLVEGPACVCLDKCRQARTTSQDIK